MKDDRGRLEDMLEAIEHVEKYAARSHQSSKKWQDSPGGAHLWCGRGDLNPQAPKGTRT